MTLSVEAQGSVLIARDNRRLTPLKVRAATKRGSIRVFSNASRRRLIELMARLNVSAIRTSFITLTFSGVPTPHEAKRAFKAWCMRLRRKFPRSSAIWRMEIQKRGSIHFHLIAFNLPYWSQQQIQYAWECCTREDRSIVHVKLLRGGKRQAMHYVAKYLAKTEALAVGSTSLDNAAYPHASEAQASEDFGRFWGWVNFGGLPFDVRRSICVDDDRLIETLWRVMSELSQGRAGQQLKAARLYGACCYDLAEKVARSAKLLLYDITHIGGEQLHWSEVALFGGLPLN